MATNGIVLHCRVAGPARAPLVVLLHGFPDCAHSWRFQVGALAAAGHRVIAPNLRGYDGSSRPAGIAAYTLNTLAADVAGLVRAEGAGRAALVVGHDWGGVIAWRLAAQHPELVARLAIVNAPHPQLMRRELSRNPGQMLRSLYVAFFQLPKIPELLLGARDFALLERSLRRQVRAGALTAEDWAVMRDALAAPGVLTAAVNYYRAAARRELLRARSPGGMPAPGPMRVPGVVLWGERDPFLSTALLRGLDAVAPAMRIERLAEAGHWAHWDELGRVNDALLALLAEAAG